MRIKLDRNDWSILIALVLFTLFFRLATLMMIHTGVDERDYWYSAKALSHGLPYPDISHRTTRFAVILPVALAQLLLGSHPNVYYVLPIMNSLIQVALAFVLGLRLRGALTGFLAGLGLALFPYMIRAGSQVRPEIFSITYILVALCFFVEYLEREDDDIPPLVWTAAFLFIAYEAKITNLFFVPGMVLVVLIQKKKLSHAFILCGILLGLFLAETGLYAIFTSYKLGELDIILKNHFQADSMTLPHLIDLLGRYSSANLQAYWQIPFAAFGLASIVYLMKGRDKRIRGIIVAALSFFLFLTLEVKSLNPITPAESFINRYFSAALGPVFLVLAFAVEGLLRRFLPTTRALLGRRSSLPYLGVLALGAVAVLGLFSLPRLPSSLRPYANSILHLDRHPLALNEGYRRLTNTAYDAGTPIVSIAGLAGINALYTCMDYFLDQESYVGGKPPAPAQASYGGKDFLVLSRSGSIGSSAACVAALRTPFRLIPMGIEGITQLGDAAAADEE